MGEYDIDKFDEFDNLPDGKKNMAISALLFGLSLLSYKLAKNNFEYLMKVTHTTRSLEAMISGASFLIPTVLLGGSIEELIVALYRYFKKKKSVKKLTLTKE